MASTINPVQRIGSVLAEKSVAAPAAAAISSRTDGLTFSKHLNDRINRRNLDMNPERLGRLSEAVDRAADKGARDHIAGVDIQIPFAGHVDFAAEKARIAKEIAKLDAEISKIQQKLDNPDFRSRAPAEVIAKSTQDVTEAHNRRQSLIRQAQQLEG